jgi:hypothetical protein
VLHVQGTATGPLDALDVELRGRNDNRSLALDARLDVPHRRLDVPALEARGGGTMIAGAGHFDARNLDAHFVARLAPHEAALIGLHPAAPIRLQVALHGPTRAAAVRVQGRLRGTRVALVGRVDVPARRGRLRILAHDVRTADIDRRAPDLAFSGSFNFDGTMRAAVQGKLSVTDGSLQYGGLSFERVNATGRIRLGRSGEAYMQDSSGRLRGRRPRAIAVRQAMMRWDRSGLRVNANDVVVDQNRATANVVYSGDRAPHAVLNLQRLSVSPALVEEVLRGRPSRPWLGQANVTWTPAGVGATFALGTGKGLLRGAAQLRRDGRALEVPSIALSMEGSHLRGAARVKNGELVASIDELIVQPELVRSFSPQLYTRTARIQGVVAGPLHALDLHLLATAGSSTARLRGQVNLGARSVRLVATTDNLYMHWLPQTRSSRINLELSVEGRLVEGGISGKLTVRHAWGTINGLPLDAARLDVTLEGPRFNVDQVLVGVPGAVVEGKGGGSYRDFHIGYGVVVTDALQLKKVPEELRLLIGFTAWTPGRSVVGSVQRHQGGKVQFSYRAVPPPFRWLNMLYHLMAGHPLHLTVH